MGDTVECVRPDCDEVYDPEQTGGSCPTCQTPHPDVPSVPDDDDETNDDTGEDKLDKPDEPESPTCPNGHEVDADAQFCPECGEPIPDDVDEGSPTCPNGHEVDADAQFCPECGESVSAGGGSDGSAGPSVTLEIGSQSYDVIEDGQVTVHEEEKTPDVFGTQARKAAQAEGVDADTALQIHRDYLSFRVDGNDCYVTNEGKNPTKYNGDNFQQGEEREMNEGDTINLGADAIRATVRTGN